MERHSGKMTASRPLISKLGLSIFSLFKELYMCFINLDHAFRLQVFRLISEIYDCGVMYTDPSPRNVCVGANGKDLRIIDFEGGLSFNKDPDKRAPRVFKQKVRLLKRLKLFDGFFDEICRSSAQRLDIVSNQVGILIQHQRPLTLDSKRHHNLVNSITSPEANLKLGTRKRRFSSSS